VTRVGAVRDANRAGGLGPGAAGEEAPASSEADPR
jgi:hypothetical protein